MNNELRWKQRFQNFERAYQTFNRIMKRFEATPEDEVMQMALVQSFEFTYELAWNVMKDYLEFQGYDTITGSRDAIRLAFKMGLVADGENWIDTIVGRNKSAHTYDAATADNLLLKITNCYIHLFNQFAERMGALMEA